MTRSLAASIALCGLASAAYADTKDCDTIADRALRFTCYDKINRWSQPGVLNKNAEIGRCERLW